MKMESSTAKTLLRKILVFSLFVTVLAKGLGDCSNKKACGECIQTPECQWCSQISATNKRGMCYRDDADLTDKCLNTTSKYVENPQNDQHLTKDVNLTEANSDDVDALQDLVQLQPQGVKLKLRRGVPINITVKYRQAQDYPVDLYYLMDLSNSMKDDKETVAGLGSKIAVTLRKHTKQVRLGFGSFVDKVMLPFVDMSPAKLEKPCKDCTKPYSFRNDLPLTNDTESFKGKVSKIKMSGNMDSPEGGFDALMQVMKCTKEIKWSKNARRIIVFSTDAKFHSAGDGRLAGIIDRNDEQCHLNDNGEYDHYMKVDYPSVGQINKVAKEEKINIIFAVSNYETLYKLLSAEIEGSTYGILSNTSDNVVNLVEDQYLEISGKVELKDDTEDLDGALDIDYFVNCPGEPKNTFSRDFTCSNLKEGDEIEFKLQVTLQNCPDESEFSVTVGTTQDKLTLQVEALCDCGCRSETHQLPPQKWSGECTGNGTLTCGVCECEKGYNGNACQCLNGKNGNSTAEDTKPCKKPGEEEVCSGSGNGYCECGKCTCIGNHDGDFCEYDRNACFNLNSNIECSGRGDCDKAKCICKSGFKGDKCECPVDNVCLAPGGSELCSGTGECVCGECTCKNGTSGRYCEDCPACVTGKCKEYKDCVQFKGFETGEIKNERSFKKNCSDIEEKIKIVADLKSERDSGATLCTYNDEDECTFLFTYHYRPVGVGKEKDYVIAIKKNRECPEPPNFLAIVLGVVATIVAIGLLTLLLWKIITTIHDRKEFEEFQKGLAKIDFSHMDNPIYKETTTTTQNPGYSGSK